MKAKAIEELNTLFDSMTTNQIIFLLELCKKLFM